MELADFIPRERKRSLESLVFLMKTITEELKQERELMEVCRDHRCKNNRHQFLLYIWKV